MIDHEPGGEVSGASPRALSLFAAISITLAFVIMITLLLVLGIWQLERRVWKLNLIREVDQRVHARPVPAPLPSDWPRVTDQAYLHVKASGVLALNKITLVQAVTDHGPGDWVLVPLRTDQGFTVLVNLGFVSADDPTSGYRAVLAQHAPITVVGLLRLSEPRGGFLRPNDPAAGRWYSRDVVVITHARGLSDAAPYFIDADASANRPGWPIGGLTVIRFPNSHLIYAITWFSLAAIAMAGLVLFLRDQFRFRRAA